MASVSVGAVGSEQSFKSEKRAAALKVGWVGYQRNPNSKPTTEIGTTLKP